MYRGPTTMRDSICRWAPSRLGTMASISSMKMIEGAAAAAAQTSPPKLDGAGDEIFQPATNGQSIRLESVNRSNPVYRNSLVPGAARLDLLPHVSLPCRV